MKEYALYKGENIIAIGTAKEIAEEIGVKVKTVLFYNTPTYTVKRATKRRSPNRKVLIRLDDDDESEV